VVAPTLPAPTIDTFFRIHLLYLKAVAPSTTLGVILMQGPKLLAIHICDHAGGKLAGAHLRGALHLPLKIIGDELLLDGLLQRFFDQPGSFAPTDEVEQHHAREHHRSRIDDILIRIFGRSAVSGFKNRIAIADVRAWSDAETAYLGRAGV